MKQLGVLALGNKTRDLTDRELTTANIVLKAMITDLREEMELVNSKNRYFKGQLEAMYSTQSQLLGIMQERRGSWGP